MNKEPITAAQVPRRLTAPDVPLSTRLNFLILMGLLLLIDPTSEAHVSEFAAAMQIHAHNNHIDAPV